MIPTLTAALTSALTAAGWPATVEGAELGERDGQPVPLLRRAGARREFTFPARDAAFAYLRPLRPVTLEQLDENTRWRVLAPLRLVLHRPRPATECRLAAELALAVAALLPQVLPGTRGALKAARVGVRELVTEGDPWAVLRAEHGAAITAPPPGDYLAVDFTLEVVAEAACLPTLCER